MAEYQNIFTQVQVRPANSDMGVTARPATMRSRGQASLLLLARQDRRRADRADLSRLSGVASLDVRLRRHRNHRAQHVGFGELEPDPIRAPVALARARAAGAGIRAQHHPPLNEGGWWLMAGFFLTTSILLWWVRTIPARACAAAWARTSPGRSPRRSGFISSSASSGRC